jgi:hypothetical protein
MKKSILRGDPMKLRPWIRWVWYLPRPVGLVVMTVIAVLGVWPFVMAKASWQQTVGLFTFVRDMWRNGL